MANNSARYNMVSAKNKWEEQGFHFDDSLPNYGLEQRVPATAATINAILDLPDDDPSFYTMLSALEDEDFEQIKDFLCEVDTAWNTTGRNPHSVSRLSLRPDAKLWNTRAAVPAYQNDKLQAEKKGWTRVVYMRKMDVADATPLNMAMPTPPASPDHMPAAATDEAGPSNPTAASSAPAEPRQPSVDSPPVVPAASHTTTSPAVTPADLPASRESTPDSPLGSTPEAPHPPPPAQSDEAIPLHILQLRNQLQRIETRQLQMQEETKVFQQSLINFLCYQFPAAATYFNAQPEATAAAHHSTKTQHIPSAHPSAQAGNTETLHLSSDDENDVFDRQFPRDHLQPAGASQPTRAVPTLSPAPTPANSVAADRPTPDSPARRKSKIPAGRILTRSDPTSSEEEADHQPAQKRRRRHIITSDSDDDCRAAVPTSSADISLSFTF
ncbi:hypothetical protein V6N12_031762 [Hibiscus sabdariffa]|uniref:Uncharacterized protein n=1 Tax=Hibiscus sabdariffa TaxID=183260 RepID=A0ABR2DVW5_9ROSI